MTRALERTRVDPDAIDPEEWDRLALASRNLFATREFLTCWWRRLGAGEPAFTVCKDEHGGTVALLPLVVQRRAGLRLARFAGHGPGDFLGPVGAPGTRQAVADALAPTLAELRCDVLLAEHVPTAEGWQEAVPGRVVRDDPSPLIEAESWDAYLASRTGHLRRQLGWQLRRLGKDGEVTFRLTDASTLDDDLETLFRLHASRWERQTEFGAHAPFHREFAATALERGWLRLWQLELDGETIASSYGFRYAGREWQLQVGRDPRVTVVSAGLLLLWRTLQLALDDGIGEYLLLLGGEEYKGRLATSELRLETRVAGLTLRGRSAVGLGVAADRLGLGGSLVRRA